MIADDDETNRDMLRLIIERMGYDTIEAVNGRQVLDILAQERVDLVLMDVSMPFMDGLTVTRQIRSWQDSSLNHNVPVIALTAHAMKKNHKPFLASGMNDVVTKPYSIAVLQETLRRHLSGAEDGGE